MTIKTNAMRVLEAKDIRFEVLTYPIHEEDLSAESAATALGMPQEQIFKTLLTIGDRKGYMLAMVPAGTEIGLKLLARASGNKKVEMAPLKDVLPWTGYVRGAVTPLAISHSLPIYIDETVVLWPCVGVSAGERGVELILDPEDLLQVTGAIAVDIARSALF